MQQEFGEYLQWWFRETGWGPTRLANSAGVSQSLVSKWAHPDRSRRARPSPKNLERLAPALGRSYEDLMKMAGYLPGNLQPAAPTDPGLAKVVARWPRLSDGVREAIGILAGAPLSHLYSRLTTLLAATLAPGLNSRTFGPTRSAQQPPREGVLFLLTPA